MMMDSFVLGEYVESDTTIFKGFIFAIELSWKSGQQTVAITKEHKLWKWLSSRFKDLQEVEFDYKAFQERFTVYSRTRVASICDSSVPTKMRTGVSAVSGA